MIISIANYNFYDSQNKKHVRSHESTVKYVGQSLVRYSYLSILPDDSADILAAALLMSYHNFLFLILPLIIMITYYTSFSRFFWKRNGLSGGKLVSMTGNEYFLQYIFCLAVSIYILFFCQVFEINIRWMINSKYVKPLAFLDSSRCLVHLLVQGSMSE